MTTRVIIISNANKGDKHLALNVSDIKNQYNLVAMNEVSAFTGQGSYEFNLHSGNELEINFKAQPEADKSSTDGLDTEADVVSITIQNAMEPGYPKALEVSSGKVIDTLTVAPGESIHYGVTGKVTIKEIQTDENGDIIIPEGAEVILHENGDLEVDGQIIAGGAVDKDGNPITENPSEAEEKDKE